MVAQPQTITTWRTSWISETRNCFPLFPAEWSLRGRVTLAYYRNRAHRSLGSTAADC